MKAKGGTPSNETNGVMLNSKHWSMCKRRRMWVQKDIE